MSGKYLDEVKRGSLNISTTSLSKLADALEISFLSLQNIEQDRKELAEELHQMLDDAEDSQLKIIYRAIEAVTK